MSSDFLSRVKRVACQIAPSETRIDETIRRLSTYGVAVLEGPETKIREWLAIFEAAMLLASDAEMEEALNERDASEIRSVALFLSQRTWRSACQNPERFGRESIDVAHRPSALRREEGEASAAWCDRLGFSSLSYYRMRGSDVYFARRNPRFGSEPHDPDDEYLAVRAGASSLIDLHCDISDEVAGAYICCFRESRGIDVTCTTDVRQTRDGLLKGRIRWGSGSPATYPEALCGHLARADVLLRTSARDTPSRDDAAPISRCRFVLTNRTTGP